jgi:hypothetical protein
VTRARRELFVCHASGTSRWDLPKGVQESGDAVRKIADGIRFAQTVFRQQGLKTKVPI